jgi:hypothetical protein
VTGGRGEGQAASTEAIEVDRITSTAGPEGRPRWWAWLAAALAAVGALASHVSSWLGHNGDHYYYTSGALQYASVSYDHSLAATTTQFPYPFPTHNLDYGYLNPGVAPLIYPRTLLGILAQPGIRALGAEGIYSAGLLCGLVTFAVLLAWTYRHIGAAAALVLPTMMLGTAYATEFFLGIYSEAPLICAVTLMLVALPLGHGERRWARAVAAAGLVPLMALSRQAPLLPIGMVLGGWLWAAIGTRRLRNEWLPYLVTIVPVTVVSYLLVSLWAPYDALSFLLRTSNSTTTAELLHKLPGMLRVALDYDVAYIWKTDKALLGFAVLALAGLVIAIRTPLAGVFLGSLASGAVTYVANAHYNEFRYFAPSLPMAAVLAAATVVWLARRLRRRPAHIALRPTHVTRLVPVAAASTWLVAATVVAVTIALHQPAPGAAAPSLRVTRAQLGRAWPLTVDSGTLSCAGDDYQIWFTDPAGRRLAVSGTAMKRAFHPPLISAEMIPSRRGDWAAALPLIRAAIPLCGRPGRNYQQG